MSPYLGDRVVGLTLIIASALLGLAVAIGAIRRANDTLNALLAEAPARQRHPSSRPVAATAPTEPATGTGRDPA